ncbi:Pr6Pr family membrane protein [Catenuloplanes sp. NPDC051500]|uniref:Pr6Pr family membrane protein n=1 Tax=Catenuloplanes sp. NPDC051500 TaxID=3363959 RepID=UPI00379E6528
MAIWWRPELWLRVAIVAAAAFGLFFTDNSLTYYTVLSNLIALAYFGWAISRMVSGREVVSPAPRLRGAVVYWLAITGLVAHILLNGGANPLPPLFGDGDLFFEWCVFCLHYIVPVLALADWLTVRPHRVVPWSTLPLWLLFPLGYGLFAEFRAFVYPDYPVPYPYFFLDPTENGYGWVAMQFGILAVEFAVLAVVVLGLDRLRAVKDSTARG